MFKKGLSVIKYIAFLSIGILVFWWVYKDEPIAKYKSDFRNLNYWWILLSVFLNILSQLSRAIRWNMLIKPLGYKPRVINSYFSVILLYFVNLLLPRAGEVFRCSVLSRYEKIPFTKLLGTVFVERMADFLTLVIIAVLIIASQFGIFISFFDTHEQVRENLQNLMSVGNILIGAGIVLFIAGAFFLFNHYFKKQKVRRSSRFMKRLRLIKHNFIVGIKSIAKLENKWAFIGHTVFIFVMWLMMLYVIFFAYPPTSGLSLQTGMLTFLMGGLAMLAPVQGGIGPWHFMVYETLFLYGIDKADGKVFALIAHSSTNLIYLFLGLAAFILLPLINSKSRKGTYLDTIQPGN